jgi:hypothetical protein
MTQFFALREDLLPVLAAIETKGPLRYALFGRYREPHFTTYSSGAQIPDLCVATCESAIGCAGYLVHEPSASLVLRTIVHTDRCDKPISESYALDQLHNPDTIVFQPGGLWKSDILLYGSVSIVPWSNESTKKLRTRFQSAIRKHFKRVGGYYVAAAALEMLKAGMRLTIAEQSPKEFDLSPDLIK